MNSHLIVRWLPCFLLTAVLTLGACKSTKKAESGVSNSEINQSNEEISFVYTAIIELSDGGNQIDLYKGIKKEGIIKAFESESIQDDHEYLAVFLNSKTKKQVTLSFDDPLNKHVEFVDEDGNLGKKEVTLEKDAVALRINYFEGLDYLKISRREENEWKILSSIALNSN